MVIYLHGFGLAGDPAKVERIQDAVGIEHVVSPTLPFDPDKVCSLIDGMVTRFVTGRAHTTSEILMFVGSSLGGFYAGYFGHLYKAPAILINPPAFPSLALRENLGENVNVVTRERFVVTEEHLSRFKEMEEQVYDDFDGSLISLFVSKNDTRLSHVDALEAYKKAEYKCIADNGGHRFTGNWRLINSRIAELHGKIRVYGF